MSKVNELFSTTSDPEGSCEVGVDEDEEEDDRLHLRR